MFQSHPRALMHRSSHANGLDINETQEVRYTAFLRICPFHGFHVTEAKKAYNRQRLYRTTGLQDCVTSNGTNAPLCYQVFLSVTLSVDQSIERLCRTGEMGQICRQRHRHKQSVTEDKDILSDANRRTATARARGRIEAKIDGRNKSYL